MFRSLSPAIGTAGIVVTAAVIAVYPAASLAGAAIAGALTLVNRGENSTLRIPRILFFAVIGLVPFSGVGYLSEVSKSAGAVSLVKICALTSFILLVWNKVLKREPFVYAVQGRYIAYFAGIIILSALLNEVTVFTVITLRRYFSVFMLYVIAANVIEDEKDLRRVFAIIIVSHVISALAGMAGLEYTNVPSLTHIRTGWQGQERLTGYSNENSVAFALNMTVALIFSFYLGMTARKAGRRLILFAVSLVLLAGILSTYARTLYVGIIIALLYSAIKLRKRVSIFWLTMSGAVLVFSVLPFINFQSVYDRIMSIWHHPLSDISYFRRLAYNVIGLDMVAKNPFLGVGPGNFTYYYATPAYRYITNTFNMVGKYVHNMYLFVACDAGIAGLACFLAILAVTFRGFIRTARSLSGNDGFLKKAVEMLEIAFVVYLVVGLTLPSHKQKYLWLMIGLSAAVTELRRKQIKHETAGNTAPHTSP